MHLFDSHCHLDLEAFDDDRDLIWQKCLTAGFQGLMIPAVTPETFQRLFQVCSELKSVYAAVGLHPWWIPRYQEKDLNLTALKSSLTQYCDRPHCKAIGETGLDAAVDVPMDLQLDAFRIHLALASDTQLPIIIHARKAHNQVIEELKKYKLPAGGVIHAFSGSYEVGITYCKMGLNLGIGGTITYDRAKKTRSSVRRLPLESLVLETDAPDIPLQGFQGQRNSPEHLDRVAQTLSELKSVPIEQIAEQTTLNSIKLFKLEQLQQR